jgi:hypothetical protein
MDSGDEAFGELSAVGCLVCALPAVGMFYMLLCLLVALLPIHEITTEFAASLLHDDFSHAFCRVFRGIRPYVLAVSS